MSWTGCVLKVLRWLLGVDPFGPGWRRERYAPLPPLAKLPYEIGLDDSTERYPRQGLPPTAKQLRLLRKLGWTPLLPEGLTRGQASHLIGQLAEVEEWDR